jgi:hypothetical protein
VIAPYTDGDRPSVYCKFSALSKDDIKTRDDNLRLREKFVDDNTLDPITYAMPHSEGVAVNRLVQRLPMHEQQGSAIMLLRDTAATLQRLGIDEVMDLVLHNYLDEDGLERPYVSVYFSS